MKLELTKEKVAIIGCAVGREKAPFNDDSWEFWGVNNLFLTKLTIDKKGQPAVPKYDKWFEIHPIRKVGDHFERRWDPIFRGQKMDNYMVDIATLDIPIIMEKVWPEVPKSVAYPLQEVLSKYGNYFTNTISYEIALAILLGAKEIGIWGVDMAVHTEYGHQRPSCEYFVGQARGMGIKVHIPDESDLCKTQFLYAFQEKEKRAWEKKTDSIIKHVTQQLNDATRNKEIAYQKEQQGIGAIQAIKEMKKIWS